MGIPLRVLIVEDSESDTDLLLRELRRGGYNATHERVQTAEAMMAALNKHEWDIVISDYTMPNFNAPQALEILKNSGIDLPFIIVSGSIGEHVAVSAMKAGAHDYIMKGNLKRLTPGIERELREANVRREHKQAQERFRKSEERFRQLAENIAEVFWMTDPHKDEILYVSPGYEKIWGRDCKTLYERPATWMDAIHPEDRDRVKTSASTKQVLGSYDEEYRIIQPNGSIRWIRDRAFPIQNTAGKVYRVTGIAEDITERKLADEALRNAKEFSENLIQTANVIILSLDIQGNIDIFNETAEKITGYTVEELRGKNWFDILTPKDRYPHVWEEFTRLASGGLPRRFENPILTKGGEERYIMWQNNHVCINDKIVATISFGNDITERKKADEALKESEERLHTALDAARMYTWDLDVQTGHMIRSVRYQDVYGQPLSVSHSNYDSFLKMVHQQDRKKVEEAVNGSIQGQAPYYAEFRIVRPDGETLWLESQGRVYRDNTGKAARILGVTQDISERKRNEHLIEQMAFYDTLTALPNRNSLYDSLSKTIRNNEGKNKSFALLLMDLNHFKEINDTLDHHHGDLVLKEIGTRLQSALFELDTVARLGGDEFAVLLPHLAKTDHIGIVIQKIHSALHPPIMIEGLPIVVETSIGVAIYPDHGDNPDSLLQRADVAMYIAKKTGSTYVIYDPNRDRRSANRLALMAELRQAIEQEQLTLHYQPKIDLKSGNISGAEALVRWQHPQRGTIPPDEFIGSAERTGLIHPLTHWVLKTATRQCGAWRRSGLILPLSINLSARNLFNSKLPDQIAQLLREYDVKPDWLTMEITESAIMADPARAVEILLKIHESGIQISIDDFGIGYSSLNYLRKLPVDSLKVDKSFVMHMTENKGDAMIVHSTIELAHNLGLKVVAEGVENKETYDRLAQLGCDTAQGYYMSKPMSIEELNRWLGESRWGLNVA